tara:strand:+ start:304 stop:486 length:183 start_codon:yes stop_codon:yes gene_type:complete
MHPKFAIIPMLKIKIKPLNVFVFSNELRTVPAIKEDISIKIRTTCDLLPKYLPLNLPGTR